MIRKIMTNWRYYVLAALALATVVGIFGEPCEHADAIIYWGNVLAVKSAGVGCLYVLARLTAIWEEEGKLPELSKLIGEE